MYSPRDAGRQGSPAPQPQQYAQQCHAADYNNEQPVDGHARIAAAEYDCCSTRVLLITDKQAAQGSSGQQHIACFMNVDQ
jgi:hypothetical protein